MGRRRLISFLAPACLIAFALFWVMQALIGVTGELQDATRTLAVNFVRLKKDRPPELKKRERPDRKPPEPPPPPPEMDFAQNLDPDDGVGAIVPIVETAVELANATNLGGGGSDRDAVPMVRVDPQYPLHAAQRRIEGWVELRFTITKTGGVKDVVVRKAQPRKIFDQAAINAVLKWKYNPKVENGVAVERPGIDVRIEFSLARKSG